MVRLGDVPPQLWDEILDDLAQGGINLEEVPLNWKQFTDANAHDRLHQHSASSTVSEDALGIYMKVLLSAARRASAWLFPASDLFLREPLLPWAVLIILYFILRKRIHFPILVLLFLFLLNITPLYALLLFAASVWYSLPTAPKGYTPATSRLETHGSYDEIVYDYILIGVSASTYFCASILSIVGKRVLLLQPKHCPKYIVQTQHRKISFVNLTVGLPHRYQLLLDTVYVRDNRLKLRAVSGDTKVNAILCIEDNDGKTNQLHVIGRSKDSLSRMLKNHSTVSGPVIDSFLQFMRQQYDSIAPYLLSKIHMCPDELPDQYCQQSCESVVNSIAKNDSAASATVSPLLFHLPTLHCRQSIPANEGPAVSLCSAIMSQQSGGYFITGGMPRMETATESLIRNSGGTMKAGVDVKSLVIKDNRCNGVMLSDGKMILSKHGVISGLGAICTYSRLLAAEVNLKCLSVLSDIEEQRPKIKVLFSVSKTVPLGADILILKNSDIDDEKHVHGKTFWVWSPTAKERTSSSSKQSHFIVVEVEAGDSLVTLVKVPFKHYKPSASLVADVISSSCGTEIILSEAIRSKIKKIAVAEVLRMYPDVHINSAYVSSLYVGGHTLATNTAKYASRIAAESPVPGLYLCGEDIATSGFAGELQGGWMGANAALGYTRRDIQQKRNVIHDIRQFLHRATKKIRSASRNNSSTTES